ncbi:helix-turn-helix domain-containing protein [Aquimarina muelleri]|uniref:helix-turn-helix domain-containing protein n=1 Tax=Aquimarina muelleri TaxID=279356 RepID=UPI003F682A49
MHNSGLTDDDLGKIIKSRSRVSEIFRGKRKLALNHIRAINQALHIPADILIKEY